MEKILIDTEFAHNKTGIGPDLETLIKILKDIHPYSQITSYQFRYLAPRVRRKLLTCLWFISFGKINLRKRDKGIFFQSQLGALRPGKYTSKWIIRLHDLFPYTNPEWFHFWDVIIFRAQLKYAVKYGATFLVDSASTLDVLKSNFPGVDNCYIVPCKIREIEKNNFHKNSTCLPYDLSSMKYVLAVGTLEPRKNYINLLRFWKRHLNKNYKLLIVGRAGWKSKLILQEINKYRNDVLHIPNCCDYCLNIIYTNALCFISASKAEGFDLPAMEARNSYGLPLILSDIPVHREYHADKALLFDKLEDLEKIDFEKIPNSNFSLYYNQAVVSNDLRRIFTN